MKRVVAPLVPPDRSQTPATWRWIVSTPRRTAPPRGISTRAAALSFAGIAAFSVLLLAGCSDSPSRRPDIFVLLSDAFRADHLGLKDGGQSLTPFLDGLAGQSTAFSAAHAQSSWTNPSIASLFTSRYPSQHGVVSFRSRLGEQEVTLAESLHQAGYATAAFSGNVLISPAGGFAQGFDEFVNLGKAERGAGSAPPKPRAAEVDRAALAWLDSLPARGNRAPVFAYLHFMETHTPYAPEPEVLERVLTARGRSTHQRERLAELIFHPERFQPPTRESAELLEDLYAAEVASLDDELRRFFAALSARGLLDGALVVFTADHGEEFFEHGGLRHGLTLYEEVLRVPLLVQAPGIAAGARVGDTVSEIDIAPTILHQAGVSPGPSFEGRSLLPMLAPGVLAAVRARICRTLGLGCPPPAQSLAELLRLPSKTEGAEVRQERSLVRDDDKVIRSSNGDARTYDLRLDPGEKGQPPLSPAAGQALQASLADLAARIAGATSSPETRPTLDAATRDRLRALGYSPED